MRRTLSGAAVAGLLALATLPSARAAASIVVDPVSVAASAATIQTVQWRGPYWHHPYWHHPYWRHRYWHHRRWCYWHPGACY